MREKGGGSTTSLQSEPPGLPQGNQQARRVITEGFSAMAGPALSYGGSCVRIRLWSVMNFRSFSRSCTFNVGHTTRSSDTMVALGRGTAQNQNCIRLDGWNLEMIGIHHLGPDEASSNKAIYLGQFLATPARALFSRWTFCRDEGERGHPVKAGARELAFGFWWDRRRTGLRILSSH